ncbi:MAG TPA: GYD domain-containing protein [Armatimonadota bacterium]|nr:GYD domain-containing protein [Armatimonadota bacterium]
MARYVMLFNFTRKGIENVKESPARVEELKDAFREAGAEIKEFYALLGRYDTMFIAEAPDDETIAGLALAIASKGNVRTETLRAFTMDEFRKMVAAIP